MAPSKAPTFGPSSHATLRARAARAGHRGDFTHVSVAHLSSTTVLHDLQVRSSMNRASTGYVHRRCALCEAAAGSSLFGRIDARAALTAMILIVTDQLLSARESPQSFAQRVGLRYVKRQIESCIVSV